MEWSNVIQWVMACIAIAMVVFTKLYQLLSNFYTEEEEEAEYLVVRRLPKETSHVSADNTPSPLSSNFVRFGLLLLVAAMLVGLGIAMMNSYPHTDTEPEPEPQKETVDDFLDQPSEQHQPQTTVKQSQDNPASMPRKPELKRPQPTPSKLKRPQPELTKLKRPQPELTKLKQPQPELTKLKHTKITGQKVDSWNIPATNLNSKLFAPIHIPNLNSSASIVMI